MTPPPPYIIRQVSRGQYRYQLMEPVQDDASRAATIIHHLGKTADPVEALAGMEGRLRERETWAGSSPSREEVEEIEAARKKVEALRLAIGKIM